MPHACTVLHVSKESTNLNWVCIHIYMHVHIYIYIYIKRIQKAQNDMLVKIVGLRKGPDETVGDFRKKCYSKVCDLKARWNCIVWTDFYYLKHFEWAGHVARLVTYGKGRVSYRVLQYMNYDYLDRLEDVYGKGRQNHGRRFHVWRWERCIQKYWGRRVDWRDIALDRTSWAENVQSFVEWRRIHA